MRFIRAYRVRQISNHIRFLSQIFKNVPGITDGPYVAVAKIANIAGEIIDQFFSEDDDPHEILEDMGLASTTNKAFVNMFFGTSLHTMFEIEKTKISIYNMIYTARCGNTCLRFVVSDEGRTICQKFWHDKNLDFNDIVERTWNIFSGRMHVELKGTGFEFSHVFENKDPTFGTQANTMFNEFQEQHVKYINDHVPRTYLLCGKPGVGKSAFAERLSRVNDRTMRLAAASMTLLDFKSISFLVDIMKPSFLIIDDIDRNLDNDRALSSLFIIFEAFKRKHPDVTILMTVNDIRKLDAALLRPGRVDEIIDFDVPDFEQRKMIIEGYMDAFGIKKDIDIATLVDASKGLTPAYLREIALQLKYKPVEKIVKIVKRMLDLASDADVEDEDNSDVEDYNNDYEPGYSIEDKYDED